MLNQLLWKTDVPHGQRLGPHKRHQCQATQRQHSSIEFGKWYNV